MLSRSRLSHNFEKGINTMIQNLSVPLHLICVFSFWHISLIFISFLTKNCMIGIIINPL